MSDISGSDHRCTWIPMDKQRPQDGQDIIVKLVNGHIMHLKYNSVGIKAHIVSWIPVPEEE